MSCLNDNGNAERMKCLVDGVFDLCGEPFLYLKTTRIGFHNACNLAEAGDVTIGDVADMSLADEGDHMVLAQRIHFDVFDDDHLFVILLETG